MISPKLDENKIFVRFWGEIANRFDPNYYKKEYMYLEKTVKELTQYRLRDFVKFMASGVTPKVTEYGKYYSNSDNGIPFLRVQNLSPEGLDWSDCKYINKETHDVLLRRSQVSEGDLLIKITGVGRMAITSIAPEGFEGNINQHMVVVKTKNPEINEQIAAFLNSDVGEKLATHRSTGGTRPALDYSALRSIPIILNDTIFGIMDKAYEYKKEKEKEAQILLNSINSFLLRELGIVLPEEGETPEDRIFYVQSNKVLGNRFDPRKYTRKYKKLFEAISNAPFSKKYLKDIIVESVSGNWGEDEDAADKDLISCLTIRATEFDNKYNLKLDNNRIKYRKYKPEIYKKVKLSQNDILIEKSGGSDSQPVGRVAIIDKDMIEAKKLAFSNFIHKIAVKETEAYPQYVFEYLRLMHNIKITEVMQTQTNGIRNLIMDEYFNQMIILPDINEQIEITNVVQEKRKKALNLEKQGYQNVEKAKKQVEKILLGEILYENNRNY